jgi:hypothetical protein
MKSAYPELPFIENPAKTTVGLEQAVHILLSEAESECLARAVFGVMYAEASRTSDKTAFRSAVNFNYSGIQTDSGRWAYSDTIINRFRKIDVGGNDREFAGFKNNEGFFDFMLNRIKAKGFDGCNADKWVDTYIQKWWSPKDKAQYTKGTEKFNSKKAIFSGAMTRFDKYKATYTGKKKSKNKGGVSIGYVTLGVLLTASAFLIYKYRAYLKK